MPHSVLPGGGRSSPVSSAAPWSPVGRHSPVGSSASPPRSPLGRRSAGSPSDFGGATSPVSIVDSFNDAGTRCQTRKVSRRELIARALLLSKRTGAVQIGKQSLELGDAGATALANDLRAWQQESASTMVPAAQPASMPITSLSVCNHAIGLEGATALGTALCGNAILLELHLDHNCLGPAGAAALCHDLVSVTRLHTLRLANNAIGPDFPEDLARCTSLTHLHLQHNDLRNVSIELCNHPSLVKLELTGNEQMQVPRPDLIIYEQRLKHSLEAGLDKARVLKQLQQEGVDLSEAEAESEQSSLVNWSTTELRKFLLDVKLNLCSKQRCRNAGELDEYVPHMSDVKVTLDQRWNKRDWEVDYVGQLLSTHTDLKSLNGLQDWPTPPMAPSPTWNLTSALRNPLYECTFVKNRLLSADAANITKLVVDHNDLRGRAAQDLAAAVTWCRGLLSFSALQCQWDDTIGELSTAVRQRSQLDTVNGLTLQDEDSEWDLKGRLLNAIDAHFVVRILTEKGPLGNLRSLDLRGNILLRENSLAIAESLRSVQNLSELNALSLPPPPENMDPCLEKAKDSVSHVTRPAGKDDQSDPDGLGSPLSGISAISSPRDQEPFVITEGLDLRKKLLNGRIDPDISDPTSGTIPIELTFCSMIVRNRPLLVDLNFSENQIGDANMPMMCHVMMELQKTLEKVHLNDNGITQKGAQDLGDALACMKTLKVLRLNGNPLCTRGAQVILQGLSVASSIEALYLNQTQIGPFIPEELYRLRRLNFLAIKGNSIIGIPVDFLKLEGLATLWIEGNPIEFPPPPIPDLGFKRLFEWLRKSDASCAEKDPGTNNKGPESAKFERIHSASTTASSHVLSRLGSDMAAARLERASSQGGPKSQRNELWIKLARRRFSGSEEEEMVETKVREQCRLYRHGQQVQDVNFHPELPIFASCSEDRTVKFWEQNPDLVDDDIWTCSHTMKGHSDSVTHLAFTGHNEHLMLASVSRDGIIRLWLPDKDPFGPGSIWTCGQVLGNKPKEAHKGGVRSLAFSPLNVKLMLATGAEDNACKIWGPTRGNSTGDEDDNQNHMSQIVPLDDERLTEIRSVYESFSRGEIPGAVYTEEEKKLAGRGKRSLSMDMGEFMHFATWSGLLDCVPKTLLTSTFRIVSNHAKADDDKREFSFEEFCELLFRISKKAQGQAGKIIHVKKVRWNRFGMIDSIVDTDVNILNRYGDVKGLLDFQNDMGWSCLYTINDAHLGTVMALTWLPVKDPVLVSVGVDNRIKLWAFTENSRGRGQWTNTNNMRAHEEALIRDVHFVADPREEDRVCGVSSAADSSVMMWKLGFILQSKQTLDGSEVACQYLLKKGQKVEVPDGVSIFCTAFRSDGKIFAAGCMDGALLFWMEVEQDFWVLTERFKCHDGIVNRIRFGGSECLTTCVTTSEDGKCCVLDTSELAPAAEPHATRLQTQPEPALPKLTRKTSSGSAVVHITKTASSATVASSTSSAPAPVLISKAMLPPRCEARMFEVRKTPPWSASVHPERMERVEKRLAASHKFKMREVAPNSGQHVVLRCQEAVPTYTMEMSFDVNSVWYPVQAGIRAIGVDTLDADLIPDVEIVSPIVDFMPQHLNLRKPVSVKLPHHSATTENIVLLHCVDASPKAARHKENKGRQPAVWEPVPCTVSHTHVTAHVDRIRGPMMVIRRRNHGEMLLKVYAIPLCSDGRPVTATVSQALELQVSEAWHGMIEIIPATSVQTLTALSSGFQDYLQFQPLYSLAKGTCIGSVVPHAESSDVRFEIRAASLASMTWEGLHMVISIELTAWHIPDMLMLSRPATREGSRPATQEGRSSPATQDRPASRASGRMSRCGSAASNSPGRVRSPRGTSGADTTACFAFALEDTSGQEVLRLEPMRVMATVPVIRILAKWGHDAVESCSLEIPCAPGSPLYDLRVQALTDLSSPRSARRPSSRLGTAKSGRASPVGIANVIAPSSRGSPELSKQRMRTSSPSAFSTNSGGADDSNSIPPWGDVCRPHTSQNNRIPRRTQERPHTSEGMRAVPASRLLNLQFAAGGRLHRGTKVEAARKPPSPALPRVSRSAGEQTRQRSSGIRRTTSINFVPQEYEELLPAAAIGTRGYGFLVMPKTAPGGAPRRSAGSLDLADLRAEGRSIV